MLLVYRDDLKPYRAHNSDAGWDLRAAGDIEIPPEHVVLVSTGVRIAITPEYMGLVAPRSGLNSKGIFAKFGVIDAGYRGEILVSVHNSTKEPFFIKKGDRIAQLIIIRLADYGELVLVPESEIDLEAFVQTGERKDKGFGSTGVR